MVNRNSIYIITMVLLSINFRFESGQQGWVLVGVDPADAIPSLDILRLEVMSEPETVKFRITLSGKPWHGYIYRIYLDLNVTYGDFWESNPLPGSEYVVDTKTKCIFKFCGEWKVAGPIHVTFEDNSILIGVDSSLLRVNGQPKCIVISCKGIQPYYPYDYFIRETLWSDRSPDSDAYLIPDIFPPFILSVKIIPKMLTYMDSPMFLVEAVDQSPFNMFLYYIDNDGTWTSENFERAVYHVSLNTQLWNFIGSPEYVYHRAAKTNQTLQIETYFSLPSTQKEYVTGSLKLCPLPVSIFHILFVNFTVDDNKIQEIKVLLGIDTDLDQKEDTSIAWNLNSTHIKLLNITKILQEAGKRLNNTYIIKITIYLSKRKVDCSGIRRGIYTFRIYDIAFLTSGQYYSCKIQPHIQPNLSYYIEAVDSWGNVEYYGSQEDPRSLRIYDIVERAFHTPVNPTYATLTTIIAKILPDKATYPEFKNISLNLFYQVNNSKWLKIPMKKQGPYYKAVIPSQSYGSIVKYMISALNNPEKAMMLTKTYNYTVTDSIPPYIFVNELKVENRTLIVSTTVIEPNKSSGLLTVILFYSEDGVKWYNITLNRINHFYVSKATINPERKFFYYLEAIDKAGNIYRTSVEMYSPLALWNMIVNILSSTKILKGGLALLLITLIPAMILKGEILKIIKPNVDNIIALTALVVTLHISLTTGPESLLIAAAVLIASKTLLSYLKSISSKEKELTVHRVSNAVKQLASTIEDFPELTFIIALLPTLLFLTLTPGREAVALILMPQIASLLTFSVILFLINRTERKVRIGLIMQAGIICVISGISIFSGIIYQNVMYTNPLGEHVVALMISLTLIVAGIQLVILHYILEMSNRSVIKIVC